MNVWKPKHIEALLVHIEQGLQCWDCSISLSLIYLGLIVNKASKLSALLDQHCPPHQT